MTRSLPLLHQEIDERARVVAQSHTGRLTCKRGCADCCSDGLTVLRVEAERIRQQFAKLLATAAAGPEGACAFLDGAGACRIYAARPYVCRTQGLPIRFFEEDENEDIVETRDICPHNLVGPPLTTLPDEAFWLVGPTEEALLDLQEARWGEVSRIPLRELFATR